MPNQARIDLPKKQSLERQLEPQLRSLDQEIVQTFAAVLLSAGIVIDVKSRAGAALEAILFAHYQKVGDVFLDTLRGFMPDDLQITDAEATRITVAYTQYAQQRSISNSEAILETTQKNLDDSWARAQAIASEDDKPQDRADVVQMAGVFAAIKLRGRRRTIAVLETEAPAEAAKTTEAEVLSGSDGLSVAGEEVTTELRRRWDAILDQRTRAAHATADGQIQIGNDPFQVMGQLLHRPKDTSLGATIENVINCRCATFYLVSQIIAERREAFQLAA